VTRPRSPLGRYAHLHREPDPREGFEAARKAWLNTGIMLFRPEWVGEWDRAELQAKAEKLFGKRRGE
jgi:hypothetical protein